MRVSAALVAAAVGISSCRPSGDSHKQNELSAAPTEKVSLPTEPAALASLLHVRPESLAATGQEVYSREAFDTALAIFRAEVRRAGQAHDDSAEARAHMWMELAAWRLGDYKLARSEGERSIVMKRAAGLDGELSRSYNGLGLIAWNEGRERAALSLFDSAIATAKRNSDAKGYARAAANIPLVKVELGDFEGARKDFGIGLTAARAAADEKLEANGLANLGMLEIRVGDTQAAFPLLARARQHYQAMKYKAGEANALGQLATAWGDQGQLQQAISAADSALSIARSEGLQQEVAAEEEVIADLQAKAGNFQLALRRLSAADSIDALLGLATERGTNLRRISTILLAVGDTTGAITRARDALAIHRKGEAKAETVYDRLQLAQALSGATSTSQSQAELDTARREAIASRAPALERDAASVSARLALSAHDPKRALQVLGQAEPSGSNPDWVVHDLRAEALLAVGQNENALRESNLSVTQLERERGSLGFGPLRSGYLASRVAPYSHLVAIQLARHDTAAAFQAAASVPGRELAEHLGALTAPSQAIAQMARGEKLLVRAASLEDQLAQLGTDPKTAEQRSFVQRYLNDTESEYTDLLSTSARQPSTALRTVPPTLREVQSHLEATQALTLFLCGPERTDAFLVRNNAILHRVMPIGSKAIAVRVRVMRTLMTQPTQFDAASRALEELSQLLFGEWLDGEGLRGVDHLVIVPHGALSALPFAALRNRTRARFFVEDYRITTLPSVAAAFSNRGSTTVNLGKLLVLAPLTVDLPATRRETKAIAQAIPGAQVETDSRATELVVRAALVAGRPVHIASHGTHNAQNPLFSGMFVGTSRPGNTTTDGVLEVHEVLQISTKSPLVYLSGCETALGGSADNAFTAGSDENSLAHAFLIAGAHAVVATLWRVDDASAANIADVFYRKVRDGDGAADALAESQRQALRKTRGLSWAAYTIATTN